MYAILVAAARFLLGFIFRGVVVKFVILGAIYYVIQWIAEAVLTQLDISSLDGLQTAVDALPQAVRWFLVVCKFDVGLPILLGAMLTAFLIRRLPFIG